MSGGRDWTGIASRFWYEEGSSRPLWRDALLGILLPAEGIYRLALLVIKLVHRLGVRPLERAGVPVISVGNITVGGSGKSSLCLALAEELENRGLRVAVVSHSYGREPGSDDAVIVDRSMNTAHATKSVGDEAVMMAMESPRLVVVGGADKAVSLRKAAGTGADVIIIDDGFHRHDICRDLDLVLFDSKKGIGNGHCLPYGPLREPARALERADAFIISCSSTRSSVDALKDFLSGMHAGTPVIVARKIPSSLERWPESRPESIDSLKGNPIFAFCGLGNPSGFQETLEASGARIVGCRFFRDHHPYSRGDLERIAEESAGMGAAMVVTTAKDGVKIASWPKDAPPLMIVKVKTIVDDPDNWLGGRLDMMTGKNNYG